MTFKIAASRYWTEVGQFASSKLEILRHIEWLEKHISTGTWVHKIDNNLVAQLISKRLEGKVKNSTVNRTVTAPLKTILMRAEKIWNEPVNKIEWKSHFLQVPAQRVRCLKEDEEQRIFEALRSDYHPIVKMSILTGLRLEELVNLKWPDVDWGGGSISILGKGRRGIKRLSCIPIPPSVRSILWPLIGNHEEYVFTYIAQRATGERRKNECHPITYEGFKTVFKRCLVKAEVENYRLHDNRHTAGTRALRVSKNIVIVRELLRHKDIKTTLKYAHVMQDEVARAMEMASARSPVESPVEIKIKGLKLNVIK